MITVAIMPESGRIIKARFNEDAWHDRIGLAHIDMVTYPNVIDLTHYACMLIRICQGAVAPLTDEALAWIDQEISHPWTFLSNGYIAFADQTDAMRFKLRWM